MTFNLGKGLKSVKMARMSAFRLVALLALFTSTLTAQESKWVPLFNGKDLSGWTIKISKRPVSDDPERAFSAADFVRQERARLRGESA